MTQSLARRRFAAAATGLGLATALVFGLGGCSSQQQETNSPSLSVSGSPIPTPPVNRAQFLTIMSRISTAADNGDASLSVKDLDDRFAGAALANRKAIYKARSKDTKVQRPTAVLAGPVKIVLPTLTTAFPRTVFAVVQDTSADALPTALWLQQPTARGNYQVTSLVDLMPSVPFPELPSENTGAKLLSERESGLAMTPIGVAPAYYAMVEDKTSTQFNTTHDQFVRTVRAHEAELKKSLGSKGKATYKRTVSPNSVLALATATGGALVSVYVNDSETVKPAKSGGSIETEGTVKTMLGKATTKTGYTATYGVMMLFSVPKAGHGKPVLLGVNQALVSVKEVAK